MVTYKYSAITKSGEKVNGVIEGYNELDAISRIKETAEVITKIQEVKQKKETIWNKDIGSKKINPKQFSLMCSQFAIILKSGIPIARCTKLISNKITDKNLKKILTGVAEDVEAGRTLASSFEEKGGDVLPVTFIETIRAGEESGNIENAFQKMYEHYGKQIKMRSKVKGALTYPIFVLVIAVIVVLVLMVKVVPTFTTIFASYGADLPLMTRILIGISDFFRKAWLIIITLILLFIALYKGYESTENGKMNLAKLKLALPVLGEINTLNAASEFANNLSTLLSAGLPVTRALSITSKVMSNYYLSKEVEKMVLKIQGGKTIVESLREIEEMPDILVDMVAVGDESGELESTLDTIAKYYDEELSEATSAAVSKLEPTLLIFVAVIAGFIVIAIYMAMFEMYAVM